MSINRQQGAQNAYNTLELIKQLDSSYICGVELSGDPRNGKFVDFIPVFDRARQQGLKISLHCAEIPEQMGES